MNRQRLEEAARLLLDAIGDPIRGEEIEKTPRRVADAWADDLVSGYSQEPREILTWTPVEGEQGLVVVRKVDFQSVCVHHLLPFIGWASIAYVPDRRLAGLSKFPRLVDCLARRLQLQERLTSQILDTVVSVLEPRGAACLLVAEHQCMSCRGVRRPAARVVTVRAHGACDRPPLRDETMRLLQSEADD